jgi:hypothetical protein
MIKKMYLKLLVIKFLSKLISPNDIIKKQIKK